MGCTDLTGVTLLLFVHYFDRKTILNGYIFLHIIIIIYNNELILSLKLL